MTSVRGGDRRIDDPRPQESHHTTLTEDTPLPAWDGFTRHLRDLARALCQAAEAPTWHAQAWTPAFPSRDVDQHDRTRITIDDQLVVEVTRTTPAGSRPERWSITVNGQPIPHRPLPGEPPHHVVSLARSIWRHLRGIRVPPCRCGRPATVAAWPGGSTCPTHMP